MDEDNDSLKWELSIIYGHLDHRNGVPLKTEMGICFAPSLQHLASSKIVSSFFNKLLPVIDVSSLCDSPFVRERHPRLKRSRYMKYSDIKDIIKEDIRRLTPCTSLQEKLEKFISPLYCEIKEWLNTCYRLSLINYDTLLIIIDNIPQCWLSDGTIDIEKSAKSVVNNSGILINRFIFACTYCLYEDVLILWELLSETEKEELRSDSDFVVKEWITWLESRFNKEWQFCVAWILGTPLWKKNSCVLRRVLGALTPVERDRYMLNALAGSLEINSDVVRLVLSVITSGEQECVIRESPVDVFKYITSWPARSNFLYTVDIFLKNITADVFRNILHLLLLQLKYQERDCFELLVILKTFWTKSPHDFRIVAKDDPRFAEPLHFVLEQDFTQEFPRDEFLACCKVKLYSSAAFPDRQMIALFPSFM